MAAAGSRARAWVAAVVLVGVLLGAQAAGDRIAPPQARADTTRLIGRSGFAYLTGIRTFAAAVLWSRLDVVNDQYYEELPLAEKKFLMPSIRLIITLDPNFDEAYYVGPFVLWSAGLKGNALELAREGATNNPGNALMQASYAQILGHAGRFADAAVYAERALAGEWKSQADYFDMLAPMEIAFDRTGAKDRADFVRAERVRLSAQYGFGQRPAEGQD